MKNATITQKKRPCEAIPHEQRKKTRKHYRRGHNMAKHVSLSGGYRKFSQSFHADVERKECASIIKGWVKKTFDKETAKNILRNDEWRWNRNHVAAYCYWTALEDANKLYCARICYLT